MKQKEQSIDRIKDTVIERMAAFLKSTGNPLQMAAGDMITELLRRIKELEREQEIGGGNE